MPFFGSIKPKPKPAPMGGGADVLDLTPAQRVFGPGRPDALGFVTSAERALAKPPPRFRDVQQLTPDQWRKLMREGGASKEAFTWQIEPALKALADEGFAGDIPKAKFEEALARNRATLRTAEQSTYSYSNAPFDPSMPGAPETQFSDYIAPGQAQRYRQEVLVLPGLDYKSHNWNTRGAIGHIRTTERRTASGKVLHVEELQSDLHQEGAKFGYTDAPKENMRQQLRLAAQRAEAAWNDWINKNSARYDGDFTQDPVYIELTRERRNALNRWSEAGGVGAIGEPPPRAPIENWEEPFIRHALQTAARDGYDTVTFPTHATLHDALQNDGTQKFYDQRLPATLARVAKSLGLTLETVTLPIAPTSLRVEEAGGMFAVMDGDKFVSVHKNRGDADVIASGAINQVPAIRLTRDAKRELSKGVVSYGVGFAAAGAGMSLLFGEEAEAMAPKGPMPSAPRPRALPMEPVATSAANDLEGLDPSEFAGAIKRTGYATYRLPPGTETAPLPKGFVVVWHSSGAYAMSERQMAARMQSGQASFTRMAQTGAVGVGAAAFLMSGEEAEAGTLSKAVSSGKIPKISGPVKAYKDEFGGKTLEYTAPDGSFGIRLQVDTDRVSKGDAVRYGFEDGGIASAMSEAQFHKAETRADGRVPQAHYISFDLTTEVEDLARGATQSVFGAAIALTSRHLQRERAEVYSFSGASRAHDKLYRRLMMSGVSFPGYRSIVIADSDPASKYMAFYLLRNDIADKQISRMLEDVGGDSYLAFDSKKKTQAARPVKGDAPGGWTSTAAFAAALAYAGMTADEAEAQEATIARAMTGGVRASAGDLGTEDSALADPEAPIVTSKGGRWVKPGPSAIRATPETQAMVRAAREEQARQLATPDFWSGAVPAAFRRENVVGSWLSDERITDHEGRAAIARGEVQAFNPFEGDYLEGFEDDAAKFDDTLTQREADSLKRQILREREDMRILSVSGFPGFMAQMAAGTIDPTLIIPTGWGWKAGDNLLMFVAKGAYMGGSQAVISETLLNTGQELRTVEENALALAGGTLFGGLLGAGASQLMKPKEKAAIVGHMVDDFTLKGDDDPQFADARADQDAIRDAVGRNIRPGSAGAAAVDGPDLAAESVADAFGLAKASGAVGLNPIVRLAQSPSAAAREASNMLAENGMFLKRNMMGEASPVAVETAMRLHRGVEARAVTHGRKAYRDYRKAGGGWSRTEFLEEVGRALRRGDDHADAHVKMAAAGYRQMFDTMKDEAIRLGMLPEDIAPETAASYYHRMWNRKALTSRPEAFENMASEYLLNAFEGMKRRAMELEVDLEGFKAQTEESRTAMREAGKASTVAKNKVKTLTGQRKSAEARLAAAEAELKALADAEGNVARGQARPEWDAMAGDPAAVKELDRIAKAQDVAVRARNRAAQRLADLDAALGKATPEADARLKDYEAAKRSNADTRGTAKLSDEDAKLVEQARQLIELERVEGSLDGLARTRAKDIYRELTGYDMRTMPPRMTLMDRGPLAERTFHIPDLYRSRRPGLEAAVEEFLVDDVEAVAQRYMRVMSTDIEITRAFGDVDMKKAIDGVNEEFDTLISESETAVREAFAAKAKASGTPVDAEALDAAIAKEKRKLNDRRKRDVKDLAGVRDILRGTYGNPADPENLVVRGAAIVRNWNYITLLGGMTITAFSDVAGKVLSNGFLGIARDMIGPLITDLKGVKLAAGEAREYGIAVEWALSARQASLADIGDVYGKGTAFDRALNNVANTFSTVTGMRLWNDVMRTADYIISQNRAIRILQASAAGKKVSARDQRWLAWAGLDLDSGVADIMRKALQDHGDIDRGMRLANSHLWADQDAARQFRAIMGKEANTATVEVGAGDKLLMMHGELGKTIGQFRSFTFAAHQRVTLRAAQQLRAGDAAVGSWFVAATSLGMMVYALKMWDSLRDTSDDPATWVREGLDRSGIFPMLFEGYNSAEKILQPGEKHPLKWMFPGDASSRFQSRGSLGSLIGPSFGRVDDVLGLIGSASDGKLKDIDLHAARKMLPFNNLFGFRQILDRLEIEAVAATGAEETAFSARRQAALAN